jgi:molybdopterin synthase sulfur carrier subunit
MATVRYFAAARAAAGVSEERLPAGTVAQLRSAMEQAHGERLAKVLAAATLLVDGIACRDHEAPLAPDATVDVLPPFAGG